METVQTEPALSAPQKDRRVYYGNLTFMLCLPRSRSKWMAEFLATGATTMHDPLKKCASIEELGERIDRRLFLDPDTAVFVADTAAVLFYEQLRARFPGARWLVVSRPVEEVRRSLEAQGVPAEMLHEFVLAFTEVIAQVAHTRSRDFVKLVRYHEIDAELHNVWKFVGVAKPLWPWYVEMMTARNIQVPFHQQQRETDHGKVARLFASRGK